MNIDHKPVGTCCSRITVTLNGDIIEDVNFERGCQGNLLGIKTLVTGKNRKDVIQQLKGIRCYGKETSCPDQLAIALSYDEEISSTI